MVIIFTWPSTTGFQQGDFTLAGVKTVLLYDPEQSGEKLETVVNRKMLMSIQHRMGESETELKRIVSADAMDMEKPAGLKSLIALLRAAEE